MADIALDPAFERAVAHFNAREFFEAHEQWEELWLRLPEGDARRFVQGLIQIAAGLHKLMTVKHPASAVRLLTRGEAKLRAHAAGNPGVAADELCAAVEVCLAILRGHPAERIAETVSFDAALLPRLSMRPEA